MNESERVWECIVAKNGNGCLAMDECGTTDG